MKSFELSLFSVGFILAISISVFNEGRILYGLIDVSLAIINMIFWRRNRREYIYY